MICSISYKGNGTRPVSGHPQRASYLGRPLISYYASSERSPRFNHPKYSGRTHAGYIHWCHVSRHLFVGRYVHSLAVSLLQVVWRGSSPSIQICSSVPHRYPPDSDTGDCYLPIVSLTKSSSLKPKLLRSYPSCKPLTPVHVLDHIFFKGLNFSVCWSQSTPFSRCSSRALLPVPKYTECGRQ